MNGKNKSLVGSLLFLATASSLCAFAPRSHAARTAAVLGVTSPPSLGGGRTLDCYTFFPICAVTYSCWNGQGCNSPVMDCTGNTQATGEWQTNPDHILGTLEENGPGASGPRSWPNDLSGDRCFRNGSCQVGGGGNVNVNGCGFACGDLEPFGQSNTQVWGGWNAEAEGSGTCQTFHFVATGGLQN
jgi:hypothetical protein